MDVFHRVKFVLSVLVLLSFGSSQKNILGVDGAIVFEVGAVCHPDNPDMCYGEKTYWSPSPVTLCEGPSNNDTCETTYQGGWGWEYVFMKGLKEGMEDPEAIRQAEKYLSLVVTVDDDESTCNIQISDVDCNSCSTEGCAFGQVKYDCTNIEKGTASLETCEPVDDPFLYPYPPFEGTNAADLATKKEDFVKDSSSDSHYDVRKYPTIVLGFAATLLFAFL